MRDALLLLGVLAALAAALSLAGRARAAGWLSPELSRKSLHIALGLACAAFPFIFEHRATVPILGIATTTVFLLLRHPPAFLAARISQAGASLHSVNRPSLGEIWFVAGVTAVWLLSDARPEAYCTPLLVLAFADAAAALVGNRSRHTYSTDEGHKTWEGSIAFLATAAAIVAIGLAIGGTASPLRIALQSLLAGGIAMLIESIARRGMDNILIPLVCWAQLQIHPAIPTAGLALRLLFIAGLATLTLRRPRTTRLNDVAFIGAGLATYAGAALGGWHMGVPAAICCGVYAALHGLFPSHGLRILPRHDTRAVSAAALPILLVMLVALAHPDHARLDAAAVGAVGAATALLPLGHGWSTRDRTRWILGALLSGMLATTAGLALLPQGSDCTPWLIATAPATAIAFAWIAWRRLPELDDSGLRWILQGLAALAGAATALIP